MRKPLGTTLASRWTPEQLERAYTISNDIAEDIDNRESREALREAVAVFADLHCDASTELLAIKCEVKCEGLIRDIKKLLDKTPRKKPKFYRKNGILVGHTGTKITPEDVERLQ